MHTLASCVQTVRNWANTIWSHVEADCRLFFASFSSRVDFAAGFISCDGRECPLPNTKWQNNTLLTSEIMEKHGSFLPQEIRDVQPTVLITSDLKRNEHMANGGSACLCSSQHAAARLRSRAPCKHRDTRMAKQILSHHSRFSNIW